jgi:hypothetical protein
LREGPHALRRDVRILGERQESGSGHRHEFHFAEIDPPEARIGGIGMLKNEIRCPAFTC